LTVLFHQSLLHIIGGLRHLLVKGALQKGLCIEQWL
jgi:hypothetical protein